MALADGRVAGLLRGSSELVLLDGALEELSRAPAPEGAIAGAESDGILWVAGERSPALWAYARAGDTWLLSRQVTIPHVTGLRGLAASGARLFALDAEGGRLLTLSLGALGGGSGPLLLGTEAICVQPHALAVHAATLVVNCPLEHQLVVLDVHDDVPRERLRLRHDGPFWAFDLYGEGASLWLAATGVEDHPLDRSLGSFGYVDSFLYLYRVDPGANGASRIAATNLSELGVLTPKVVSFSPSAPRPELTVAGYGSAKALTLVLEGDALRVVGEFDSVPGLRAAARVAGGLVMANPLADAWAKLEASGLRLRTEPGVFDERTRLGETLLFTDLMAPWNSAVGPLSRFTCETCHLEGTVDGRTHSTGRGEVRATTKPLFGLFNNRPHFSRALDPDLSRVAHAEFRVAGANSGRDAIFAVSQLEFPWLSRLGLERSSYDARELRLGLMQYLMEFTPPSNPRALGRSRFSPVERAGARLFQSACESCHQARASADEPASRVPFEEWEGWVFRGTGALVWGRDGYEKTGVEPYVHEAGARPPSLRRLSSKVPYFTNGSVRTLDALLAQVRLGHAFFHQGGEGRPLSAEERTALEAFLRLL